MATIYCVGRNYAAHADELGNERPNEPVIFLKSMASLRGLEPSKMAFASDVFDHEVEVVVRVAQDSQLEESLTIERLDGIGLGLDLTRRPVQQHLKTKGLPWTTAKSFCGSSVIAPLVALPPGLSLENLSFELKVNEQLRQFGQTSKMSWGILEIINYINGFTLRQTVLVLFKLFFCI